MGVSELPIKQERFVAEYLVDFNAIIGGASPQGEINQRITEERETD